MKDTLDICRLCLGIAYEFKSIEMVAKEVLDVLPKFDLNLTIKPVICSICLSHLEGFNTFLKSCRQTEKNINEFIEVIGRNRENHVQLCDILYYVLAEVAKPDIDDVATDTDDDSIEYNDESSSDGYEVQEEMNEVKEEIIEIEINNLKTEAEEASEIKEETVETAVLKTLQIKPNFANRIAMKKNTVPLTGDNTEICSDKQYNNANVKTRNVPNKEDNTTFDRNLKQNEDEALSNPIFEIECDLDGIRQEGSFNIRETVYLRVENEDIESRETQERGTILHTPENSKLQKATPDFEVCSGINVKRYIKTDVVDSDSICDNDEEEGPTQFWYDSESTLDAEETLLQEKLIYPPSKRKKT